LLKTLKNQHGQKENAFSLKKPPTDFVYENLKNKKNLKPKAAILKTQATKTQK
jgi:hypothetical protein